MSYSDFQHQAHEDHQDHGFDLLGVLGVLVLKIFKVRFCQEKRKRGQHPRLRRKRGPKCYTPYRKHPVSERLDNWDFRRHPGLSGFGDSGWCFAIMPIDSMRKLCQIVTHKAVFVPFYEHL
jgi:hypothetical protein